MKAFFTAIFAIALFSTTVVKAQAPDPYPRAKIYINDQQSGQQVEATDDLAIQFKNALIDLVKITPRSRRIVRADGQLSDQSWYTISQMPAGSGVNGFQISLDDYSKGADNPFNFYTFSYHIGDMTLYSYD